MDALLVALQFLTRVPLPVAVPHDDSALGRSALYYPLVGLLLGFVLTFLAALLSGDHNLLSAALVLSAWVLLTGGLHLDGLADCADAWVGGFGDPQRSLQIMKDPASGPIAIVTLILVLLLKWTALATLFESGNWWPLLMTPVLGRSAILLIMLSTPYVSPKGLASTLLQHLPVEQARNVLVISTLFSGIVFGGLPTLVAGLAALAVRQAAMQRLGGATGDVYGAAVELTETTVLLAYIL